MNHIKWINYGIAYTVTTPKTVYVELNHNLKKHPSLLVKVLRHERQHLQYIIDKKNILWDFWHDIKSLFDTKYQAELKEFVKKYPKAKQANKTFFKESDGWSVNYFMVGFWIVFGGLLLFSIYLLSQIFLA